MFKFRFMFWPGLLTEATFGTLVFTSCVLHLILCQILKKNSVYLQTWSLSLCLSFWIVYNRFDCFRTNFLKSLADAPKTQTFFKKTLRLSKMVSLCCALLFSLLLEVRVINLHEILPIFVLLQGQVLPALVFEIYVPYFGFLHPAFELS